MSPEDGFFMVVRFIRILFKYTFFGAWGPQQGHLRWPGVSRSLGGWGYGGAIL